MMTSGERSQLVRLLLNVSHAGALAYDNMDEEDAEKYEAREKKARDIAIAFVEKLIEREKARR